jgi:hypothetical protein
MEACRAKFRTSDTSYSLFASSRIVLRVKVGQPLELFPASVTQALSKVARSQVAQEGLMLGRFFFMTNPPVDEKGIQG